MSRIQRSEKIRCLKENSLNLKTFLVKDVTASRSILKEKVEALDKAYKEAHESHIDFLVDETIPDADKVAAEQEYDDLFLKSIRILCEGEDMLESIQDNSSETIEYLTEIANSAQSNTENVANQHEAEILAADFLEAENMDNTISLEVVPDSLETSAKEPEELPNKSIQKFIDLDCDLCEFEDVLQGPEKVHICDVRPSRFSDIFLNFFDRYK